MTLVLTVNGPDTIWMLTDRRISFARHRPKDDGRKMMVLETSDGVAMLGYAGLGLTAGGTEPADWMSAVLRGRNIPLEHCLVELSSALARQFPRHLAALPVQFGTAHSVLIPAFLRDEPRLYSIELSFSPDRKSYSLRNTRHAASPNSSPPRAPRMSIAGSGAAYLRRDTRWIRELLKMVRACDKKSITPHVVADYLAGINNKASLGTVDNSVGPRSIVAWRHRKGSRHGGGGGHQLYHGIEREDDSGPLPNLVNGLDIEAMFVAMAPIMMNQMCALMEGGMDPGTHHEAMNAVLSELPHNSDEMLK